MSRHARWFAWVPSRRSLIRVVPLSFFLFTAVVAPIPLALLHLEVTLVSVARLQLFDTLLELTKVKFEIFVNLSHFQVLFLKVLTTFSHLGQLLIQIDFCESERGNFFLCLDELL